MNKNPLISSSWMLTAFVVVAILLVATTREITHKRITEQKYAALQASLGEIVPNSRYNNDLVTDAITVNAPAQLGKGEKTVFRARLNGKPTALIIQAASLESYSGIPIELLVGIKQSGEILGVRVTSHKETPGLGDGILLSRSDWVLGFNNKSLSNTSAKTWNVKKDGGEFDQFTGATITPRAVVRAVERTLRYAKTHQNALFSTPKGNHYE